MHSVFARNMLLEKQVLLFGGSICPPPRRVAKSLDKRKETAKQDSVLACDPFAWLSLAHAAVRLLLQYDGRLVQQIILPEC